MIAVLQRVSSAFVRVQGSTVGEIGKGLVILLGVGREDTEREAEMLASKILRCRIFTDEADKMNLSLTDVGGGALVVSNFTLYGDASHGRRPAFVEVARPEVAEPLFNTFVQLLKEEGVPVQTGVFGADMTVAMQGNGPVTIWLDTAVDAKGL